MRSDPRASLAYPFLLTLACLLLGCPTEEGDDDDSADPVAEAAYHDPMAPGPFAVGVREELLWVPELGIDTPLEIWYPAVPTDGELAWDFGLAVRNAQLDPAEAPFPVVVFSHGHRAIRFQSAFWCDRLASHGYVVAAPDHTFNTVFDFDDSRTAEVALNRPRDVSAVLDFLIDLNRDDGDPLGDRLAIEQAAVAGHSFGGWTAAAVAGWEVQSLPLVDPQDLEELGIEPPLDLSDDRFSAAISMTPAGPSFMGTDGLDKIGMPVLYFGGEWDGVCPPDEDVVPMFEHTPPPAHLVMVAEAGHYGFSNMCDLLPGMFDDCGDPYRPAAEVQEIANAYSLDFLGLHLRGDERYGGILASSPPFEGVEIRP